MPKPFVALTVNNESWAAALPNAEDICNKASLAVLKACRWTGETELSLVLSDDAEVQALNAQYRNQDKPTNVLSFPSGEPAMPGDVILAFETCAKEAKEQDKTLADHFTHLVVHGLLHLMGYDHEEDDQADDMESLETEILAELGVGNPYEENDFHPS